MTRIVGVFVRFRASFIQEKNLPAKRLKSEVLAILAV
jgi:hypothetical protein